MNWKARYSEPQTGTRIRCINVGVHTHIFYKPRKEYTIKDESYNFGISSQYTTEEGDKSVRGGPLIYKDDFEVIR